MANENFFMGVPFKKDPLGPDATSVHSASLHCKLELRRPFAVSATLVIASALYLSDTAHGP